VCSWGKTRIIAGWVRVDQDYGYSVFYRRKSNWMSYLKGNSSGIQCSNAIIRGKISKLFSKLTKITNAITKSTSKRTQNHTFLSFHLSQSLLTIATHSIITG